MTGIVPYAIWAVLIVSGLSLLTMVVFSIKALAQGKVEPLSIILVAIPIVIFGVLGLVLGDWALAAVYGFLISLTLSAIALLLSGMRGLFGM
ncbi:MAG: hypothetical protein HKN17_00995 [Rhodothermales bacterium]|nr:hypothetical protein [Rhodothermales bacterium]